MSQPTTSEDGRGLRDLQHTLSSCAAENVQDFYHRGES